MKLRLFLHRTSLLFVFVSLSALSVLAQASAVHARVMQPVDLHNLVTLHGNVHPLARPEYDQGVAPDDLPMERILLVLQRGADQEAALRQMLDDQQVKSSARYHQWLTPEQFGQQFGPADSDLQAVTGWLASQGFEVTKVSAGRTVIEFSGSAGLVRQVLGTEIHKFRVNGEDYWANTSDPQIPAALAPVVAGIDSLNNFPAKPMHENLRTVSRPKTADKAQPLFTYPVDCPSGSGEQGCYEVALGPTDFATIYNVLPLWNKGADGGGVTIAVVGESNINPQDVADFRSMFGLPANPPNVILNGPDPGLASDETEADLDVEWSGAVAKGATIDLVVSETTEATLGVDLSALYIIDNDLAPIMSESYGVCEAQSGAGGNIFHSTLWEQAAAQGITVLMATGDTGSAVCDREDPLYGEFAAQYGLSVSGFASTPFDVAVGGTDLNITSSNIATYFTQTNTTNTNSSALSYVPETTWNDSCAASGSLTGCTPPPSTTYLDDGFYLIAGSGGPSNCINPTGTFPSLTCSGNYAKPSWQSGTGVPSDGARDIPDVSLLAVGYVICEMDANGDDDGSLTSCDLNAPYLDFQLVGGTSASVQAFAGVMAMVNQAHGRQGNANYVLYPMAAESGASCNSTTAPVTNSSCVFYDVTVGNNSVICQGGSPNCSNTNSASGQYGILVSGNPSFAAYTSTSGYDLATGLGSVNVANLVNNWKSNFTPSSITLALATNPVTNPITLTHGQPIDYTINVGSGSGTPTGDVSLIAQAGSGPNQTTGIGPFTLNAGSATGSTIMLPGGSYNVTAHYAGNGTLAASDSTPGVPVTVRKENSLTELRSVTINATTPPAYNATTVPYAAFFLRMDVTNSSGQLCASTTTGLISYPCPGGALTVSPAPINSNPPPGTNPGHDTLNTQGFAEEQTIQQPPGGYTFVASYAGDNNYNASTSATLPITITQAPTTTSAVGLPSSTIGVNVSFTATVNTQSRGIAPTGTVQLLANGNPVDGPYTLNGTSFSASNGTYAMGSVNINESLPEGNDSLTLQYSGDSNYAGSVSSPVMIAVRDYALAANPSTINIPAAGQSGTSAITISSLNGFAGTITLSCDTGFLGVNCTISPGSVNIFSGSSSATATLTVSTQGPVNAFAPSPLRTGPPSYRLPIGWYWKLAMLLALAAFWGLAVTRRRIPSLLFAVILTVVGVWAACGGGGGGGGSIPPPTPTPAATVLPTSLAFSQQATGSTSAPQSVTVTNSGTAALSIAGIAVGGGNSGDFAQTNNCGSSLATSATCAINVAFTPTAMGARSASLSITDNSNGSPQTVSLTGTGTQPPPVNLSPTNLAFGQQNMSVASAPQTVNLSNNSSSPLSISNIAISGSDYIDFAQTNNCGSNLAVGAQCAINVTFTPITTGSRTSTLTVTDSASGSPQTANLTGTGVQLATASLSPATLTFGPENINLTTAPQTVTLSNTGSGLLVISKISFQNGDWIDFNQTNNCGSSVPAGANCKISVAYSPQIAGQQFSDLNIFDNASGSPQYTILNATGVPPITPAGSYWVTVTGSSAGSYSRAVQLSAVVQ